MKKFVVGLIISFTLSTMCFAQEIIYDLDVKKGFEIIGSEERPRVIFLMPEFKLPLERRDIPLNYTIKDNLIEKDIDEYLKNIKDIEN